MTHDIRHAFRVLFGRPGFTALAVVTLALGIGANTAMFSVVHGVLLRPLPYPAPDRIVRLWEQTDEGVRVAVSNPNFLDWRERAGSFAAVAAYAGGRETVLGGLEPEFASVYAVSDGFLRVFGVAPETGRTFVPEETRLNGTPAVVVSHGFWERSLGSNPALETLHLRIAGLSCRIVGVMPAGFAYPAGAEVWIPRELFDDTSGRTGHNYSVVARLRDGVELSQARAEMNTIAGALWREHTGDNDAVAVAMLPLHESLTGASRNLLVTLLGAVGLVLLIACANVASMLLAQGEERRTELAIRAALGAGRFRLVRQLLVENTVIAAAGAAAGLLLAAWLVPVLRTMQESTLPRVDTIGIDGAVLVFTAAMAFLTPLVFGLLPSIQISRAELRDAMAEGGRSSASPARARVRSALVAAEVAVALLLLVGAALMVRTFSNILSVDAGFDSRGVVTAEMAVPAVRYSDAPRAASFYAELLPRLRAVAGVRAAGAINQLPLSGTDFGGGFRFEGSDEVRYAGYRVATDGYFDAMGIALRRGRVIGPEDQPRRTPVAIVNEAFVRQYVDSGDPLGRRFAYLGMDPVNPTFTIVGVVADVHHQALVRDVRPEVYVAYRQQPFRSRWTMTVAVRADRPELAESLVPALRERIRTLDAEVPVRFSTLDAVVSSSIADRRFMTAVLTAFAGLALLLAAVGIYGVLAYAVARRTHEIGIRMALGAEPRSVAGLLLRGGMAPVGVGIAAGLAGAFALTRALETFLFGVRPLDPLAIAAAVGVLSLAACVGGYIPARRATRVDPLVALRRT